MAHARTSAGLIGPQQLAHLRATLYGQRGISNHEALVLFEAYEDLVRQFAATESQLPASVQLPTVRPVPQPTRPARSR